jgi:hypothetical protein
MSNYLNKRGDANAELNALFHTYRAACPDTEPSANFMPEIWRRIEERQRSLFFLGRWARAFVTAAAVLSLGMAAYLYIPNGRNTVLSVESYVEAVAAGHAVGSPEFVDPSLDEL